MTNPDQPIGHLIGTYHGAHDGRLVTVTSAHDDTAHHPYGWACTCGASRRFPTEDGLDASAWQHTHPSRWRTWARHIPSLRRLAA
ncbi:hypothetical protein HC023_09975 [Streptomyces sp. NEAU-H3]|nr:hypothetical protein [Streptomyces sp. NEAU-H3]